MIPRFLFVLSSKGLAREKNKFLWKIWGKYPHILASGLTNPLIYALTPYLMESGTSIMLLNPS